MQWGHIKTLFIVCFLILDIFLVIQLMEKQQESEAIDPLETTSRDAALRANFEGLEDLPNETVKDSYLYLSSKQFTRDDLAALGSLENQTYTVVNNQTMLISKLDEPVPVNPDSNDEAVESKVKQLAILAENYTFWAKNEKTNTLILFQQNEDKPIYYSRSALLLVFLNDQNEVVQYIQTEMEKEDQQQEGSKELIKAMDAVAYLDYHADELLSGDEITDAKLGYHTLTALQDSQVFVPSWRIQINDNRNYLVNAVEGGEQLEDNLSFLRETLSNYSRIIAEMEAATELLEETKNRIDTILDTTTWSEENDN